MYKLLLILITLFLFTSCSKNDHFQENLADINEFEHQPKPYTHKMSVRVKGKVECPCTLYIKMDGNQTNSVLKLEGMVNTGIEEDWYENKLGFYLDKPECAGENTLVELVFYSSRRF